jgi:hypothetical protein
MQVEKHVSLVVPSAQLPSDETTETTETQEPSQLQREPHTHPNIPPDGTRTLSQQVPIP